MFFTKYINIQFQLQRIDCANSKYRMFNKIIFIENRIYVELILIYFYLLLFLFV